MLSFRQRLKERWSRPENSATTQDESQVHLRAEEPSTSDSFPEPSRARIEVKTVDEIPAEHVHFIVDFVGSSTISEAKSVQILSETLKRVKKQQLRTMRVDFTIEDGILKVNAVESNALLLTAPLYAIALCAQDKLRGFDNCFALNITRKKTHMCHVFEAGSSLEAASVVRSVAVAFKTIGKLLREKRDKEERQKRSQSISSSDRTRTNSEASTVTSVEEVLRASQRCHVLYRERMDREGSTASSSLRRSPKVKRTRSLSQSGTSPSILRHTGVSHLSGRHVEFCPLSPVPSDSSDNEAPSIHVNIIKETLEQKAPSEASAIVVKAQVYSPPVSSLTGQVDEVEKKQLNEAKLVKTTEQVGCPEGFPENTTQTGSDNVDSKALVESSAENGLLDEDENFKPALQALLSGNITALERYLDDGLSENASDKKQQSLLYHAICHRKTDAAYILLKRGAEVNWEGPDDKTPLHIAAEEGDRTATKLLLRYGANVRAKDSTFCTPLYLALGQKQNLEVSHVLVEHGARINDNTLQGVRPVDLEPQLKEMQRLLVQSACEAFTAADLSKSRSNSNTSSYNQPSLPGSFRSKTSNNQSPRLERIDSIRNGHRSSSMCSIPRGGMTRSSPETVRGIQRSESFTVTHCRLSPQLGRGKRSSLRRSLSLQKYTLDHQFQLELDARIELNQHGNKNTNTTEPCSPKSPTMTGKEFLSDYRKQHSNSDLPEYAFNAEPKPVFDLSKLEDEMNSLHASTGEDQQSKSDGIQNKQRPVSPVVTHLEKTKRLKSLRQHSEESEHSGAGHLCTSECEDSSYMSGGSHCTRDEDPIIEALKSVVLLSGNPECHESLLAYLCLPKASSQLISLARMPSLTAMVADNIAVLIGNLFNLEGPESRKRSVEAGLIKTVLNLVDGAEPIQSTCLSILHNILDFDNDREYSTALQSIPLEPLLNLLHITDTDSAFEMHTIDSPPPYNSNDRGRRRKTSTCSRGSHDDWHSYGSVQRNNSGASDIRPEVRRMFHKKNSMTSMTSSAEGDQSCSLYSTSYGHGHLPWTSISPDMHTNNLPRLVATKMLAATTMNPKMQRELGKVRPLTLMLETLQDSNHDIVVHTTAALANIAMNIDNHTQMKCSGAMEALTRLLKHSDPRITYHAARGLVYVGHMHVSGIYLFKHITGDEKVDVIFAETTGSEHLYVKGATVEKIVEIATNNPSILWGGARLQPPSPKGPKNHDKRLNTRSNGSNNKTTDDQIVDFLLTMYSGFVHPIILMRLLIHRFRDPWFDKYFDGDPSTGQMDEYAPLPVVHIHLMRIWKTWLDKYPDHFINNPTIASELSFLFLPMTRAGGPYLPCAESLQALVRGLANYKPGNRNSDLLHQNHCHHAILYGQCQKAVVGGGQPCQTDDAVYLSALQLYIEDLSPIESRNRQWFFQGSSPDKLPVSRIKQSLPPSMYKVKGITKRIKAQRERFITDSLSDRNGKHNYVDFCQSIAGYGCRFFKLKECQGTINKKAGHVSRLFGINPRKVILLDDKTKSVVGVWQFKDIKRWKTSADNSRLKVEFTNLAFEFVLDNKSFVYKEITELLFSCTRSNLEALGESDFTPWSKYAEDTEKWGHIAFEEELKHQIPEDDMNPLEDGPTSRSRAISCITASKTRTGTFPRHASLVDKLSSSAPFPKGNSATLRNMGPATMQAPSQCGSFVSAMAEAPVLGATASSISPFSGLSLTSTQQSLASSEEFLIGSFQVQPVSRPSIMSKHSWDLSTSRSRPTFTRNISRESEGSEPSPSPTERNPLDPSLSVNSAERISPSGPPTRHQFLSSGSTSSIECPSPTVPTTEPIPTPQGVVYAGVNFDFENFNRMFGLSPRGQLLICHCPPDAVLPRFDRRNFTAYQLLQHPKELAKQITITDHEYFCAVTAEDIQKKVAMGTGKKRQGDQEPRLLVERVADRFNQLSTWVVASILTEDSPEKRAEMFVNFIETAKQCLEFRNFNAVMSIVVAALGSAPIRRLARTKEFIPKEVLDLHSKFEMLMDPKDNYKRYRTTLRSSPTPAVPYFGIYMKDLTFIAEGNPDFLKGGLVNLSKRRQIYLVINEIRKFQKNSYNFQEVTEIREYLLSQKLVTEEDLHQISRQLEPVLTRRYSEPEKESRSFSIPQITRSNTIGQASGKKMVKSLSIGGESIC